MAANCRGTELAERGPGLIRSLDQRTIAMTPDVLDVDFLDLDPAGLAAVGRKSRSGPHNAPTFGARRGDRSQYLPIMTALSGAGRLLVGRRRARLQ
jgi:hypothetical protein